MLEIPTNLSEKFTSKPKLREPEMDRLFCELSKCQTIPLLLSQNRPPRDNYSRKGKLGNYECGLISSKVSIMSNLRSLLLLIFFSKMFFEESFLERFVNWYDCTSKNDATKEKEEFCEQFQRVTETTL